MFYKSDWLTPLKRIIVIDDFTAKPYDYHAYISHWLLITQRQPHNGFLFGADAYDAMVKLLEDDSFFNGAADQEILEIYKFVFTNSFLPECRHCLGMGLSDSSERKALLDHMGLDKLLNPEVHEKIAEIKGAGFDMHNVGWSYWAALSAKKVYPLEAKKYIDKLKSAESRKKAVTALRQLKELDVSIIGSLKEILIA
jgi:hypothetical protein